MAHQLSAEEFSRLQSQLIELRTENYQLREKGSKLDAEVTNLRSRVSTQDREIQLKRVTSLVPFGKGSKKQKQDYEASLEEKDALYKKVETMEEEHRTQQQMLMQELSNVHDELEKIKTERDGLAASASSLAPAVASSSDTSPVASLLAVADDSELRHLKAENAVLQKTLASTRQSMQQQISELQNKLSGNSTDGPDISVLAAIGSECESDGQSTSAAELQIQFDTIKEEKRLLEEKLERQTAWHEDSLAKCQEELNKWSEKARKKQDSLRQLQEEKDALMREKEVTTAAMVASHASELERVMQQSARMQEELGNANEELISLRDAESTLRSHLASSASSTSKIEDEMKQTIGALRQEVARLQEDLNTSISSKQEMVRGQVEELEGSMAELQEKIYKAERERNQALEALDEANKVADKRKVLVDSMAIEKQNHADEVHRKLKEQGAAYEVRLESSAQQIVDLKADVLRLQECEVELKSFGSVRTKLAQEEEQRKRLEEDLESVREQLKTDADRHEADFAQLQESTSTKDSQIEELQQAVADSEGKVKIQEKKANAMMKDIRRQLELERKRSERLQNALSSEGGVPVGLSSASAMSPGTPEPLKKSRRFGELFDGLANEGSPFSFRPRSNSICSETLSNSGESASLAGSEDVSTLLARITRLQKEKWTLEERVSHLEQNAASLVEDVLQKSAIIKSNMMEPKADQHLGASADSTAPSTPTKLAPQLLRRLTSPLHRTSSTSSDAHAPSSASETTRLQRVVEETLIKNLSLQQNIDMLTLEMSRMQAEKEVLEEKLLDKS